MSLPLSLWFQFMFRDHNMRLTVSVLIAVFVTGLPLTTSTALAQTRCNCSLEARLGTCKASVRFSNKTISLKTDVRQCAMVTWFADGEPKVSTVTDGKLNEEWLGRGKPRVEVDACMICTDRNFPSESKKAKGEATAKSISAFVGTWRGTATNPVTTVEAGFVLRSVGGTITGHYFQAGEPNEPVTSAMLSGNTLKMKTGPISWTLTLSGRNQITGTWRNLFLSGPITVQRSG